MDLSKQIRIKRAELGVSRKELKQLSGVSSQRIRQFEHEGDGSIEDLIKLAGALGCDLKIDLQ